MQYKIRELKETEYDLLEDFLYEAIYIPKDYVGVLPRSIIYNPDLWRTIADFGKLQDDYCLVAETEGKVVGAVWVRIADQYGHLDDETPSFSISLYQEYRGHGIGTELMKQMIKYLKKQNYKKASLSVQKENYAVRMYQKVGFEIVGENEEEFIMLHPLNRAKEDFI